MHLDLGVEKDWRDFVFERLVLRLSVSSEIRRPHLANPVQQLFCMCLKLNIPPHLANPLHRISQPRALIWRFRFVNQASRLQKERGLGGLSGFPKPGRREPRTLHNRRS